MASFEILAPGLTGPVGGSAPERSRRSTTEPGLSAYTFVEFGGRIATLDLNTLTLQLRGTGYTEPEAIVQTADAKTAFVSERGGTLYQLDLTKPGLNKADATVLLTGQAAPHQLALDEPRLLLYFVGFGNGTLNVLNLQTMVLRTVVSGLGGPVGLLLDAAAETAFVTDNQGGRLLAVTLQTGAVRPLANGLTAPFMLSWADAGQRQMLIPERDPANRIRLFDLPAVTMQYVLRQGVPFRPSYALLTAGNKLIVNANDQVVRFTLPDKLVLRVGLTLAQTSRPFLNTYQRVRLDFGDSGLTLAEVDVQIKGGPGGGQVSLSRDSTTDPAQPEVMLLAGSVPGKYKLRLTEKTTGTLLGETPYTITDVWADPNRGPSFWGQGEFQHFARNAAWGGGPDDAQNTNVFPALGTRRICIVTVDTSTARYPTGPAYTTIRDRWFNEAVGGVTDPDGVVRSVKRYYEQMSNNAFSISLVGGQVTGPAMLTGPWASYMTLEPSRPAPAPANTTIFDPNSGFAGAVVSAANALLDAGGQRLIDFTQVQSLIVVVRSNGSQFVWPQAWSITSNIFRLDGTQTSISVPILVMPDDWNPTRDTRRIHETLAHELGHNLGMRDQYAKPSYSNPVQARAIDTYDLMSQENPLPFVSAAHRMMLGWVDAAWVRRFDFTRSGARDELVTLQAIEIGGPPPAGQSKVAEIRIADGHNYYFEYRTGQVGQIGDAQLGLDARTATKAVVGTDVISDTLSAPFVRPPILRLQKDAEGEDSFFSAGQNYKETDTDEPAHFAPADFAMEVVSMSAASATIRIRYGANSRPDPAIRPWPGGQNWQSPDIEVRNDRNLTHPEWVNMPWADHHNQVVAKVRNLGNIMAPGVRVDFLVKDFTVSNAPETFLDSVVHDLPVGTAPVEFITDWVPAGEGHRCIIARIPLYQDPGNPAVVELSQLNNEAQSNYTRFVSASASPSSREVTSLAVHSPYPKRARIAVVPQQTGGVGKFYRVYLEHTELILDPGETRPVQVMFESLAGLPKEQAELRRTDLFKQFFSTDNRVSFIGLGYDPEDPHLHAPEVLGGATVAVKSGRATRFEKFSADKTGLSQGRVVTVDTGEPATGSVLVTAVIDKDIRKSVTVNLPLDRQGQFLDDVRLRRLIENRRVSEIRAHYPGAVGLGICNAETVRF